MDEMSEADRKEATELRRAILDAMQWRDQLVPKLPGTPAGTPASAERLLEDLQEIKRASRRSLRDSREAIRLLWRANRAQISAVLVDLRNGGGSLGAAEVRLLLLRYGAEREG